MTYKSLNTIKYKVIALAVTLLFSCKNNFKNVQKMGVSANEPQGVAENINLKYTDSGRVTANLISPKMFDYNNRVFQYSEFTDGVILHLFDANNNKSTIVADYAITYANTNLIDMRGNVVVSTYEKDTLFGEQLYFDSQKEWVFTNKPVKFLAKGNVTEGNGFDSDTKFNKAEVLEITGLYAVRD